MERKKQIILISTLLIITVAVAIVWGFNNTKEKRVAREATDNLSSLIEAQEKGSLSVSGENVKQDLIANLGGEAGAILITESMEIGYLPPPDERIMVFILGTSVEQIESEAINWLLSRGFSKEDICNLPVVFSIGNPAAQPEEAYKLSTNYLPPYCL